MAFNLVGQLQLRGPTNVSQVVSQVNAQLAGIGKGVNINLNAKSIADVTKATNQAKDAMFKFGEQAGLAARRFAAFSIAAGSMITVVTQIRQGIIAAVEFERQMIRLKQVGNDTQTAMGEMTQTITQLATSFGVSSKDLASVAVTLRQAGLSAAETTVALNALTKAALAPTFGSMAETVEGAIAIMRQFNLQANQLEGALGSVNAVAAEFAVESQDIISAVQKAGGAFAALGGDLNEFMAVFTAIRQTTRESADSIATGMRTILARLQRPEAVDQLRQMGVNLRYTYDEAQRLGRVELTDQFIGAYRAIERIGEAMRRIPATDPRYAQIEETIGGYRQISRVLPMLQQIEVRERALATGRAGATSLTRAAEIAQESLYNRVQKTQEVFANLFRQIVSDSGFQNFAKGVLFLADSFAKLLGFLKPLIPLILTLTTIKLAAAATSFIGGIATRAMTPQPSPYHNIRGYASGGIVPGQGNRDTEFAMLQPGEFVIRKDSAQKAGYENLRQLNKYGDGGYIQTGKSKIYSHYPRFARQGLVESKLDLPKGFMITKTAEGNQFKNEKRFVVLTPKTQEEFKGRRRGIDYTQEGKLKEFEKVVLNQGFQTSPHLLNVAKGLIFQSMTVRKLGLPYKTKGLDVDLRQSKNIQRIQKQFASLYNIVNKEQFKASEFEIFNALQAGDVKFAHIGSLPQQLEKEGLLRRQKGGYIPKSALFLKQFGSNEPNAEANAAAIKDIIIFKAKANFTQQLEGRINPINQWLQKNAPHVKGKESRSLHGILFQALLNEKLGAKSFIEGVGADYSTLNPKLGLTSLNMRTILNNFSPLNFRKQILEGLPEGHLKVGEAKYTGGSRQISAGFRQDLGSYVYRIAEKLATSKKDRHAHILFNDPSTKRNYIKAIENQIRAVGKDSDKTSPLSIAETIYFNPSLIDPTYLYSNPERGYSSLLLNEIRKRNLPKHFNSGGLIAKLANGGDLPPISAGAGVVTKENVTKILNDFKSTYGIDFNKFIAKFNLISDIQMNLEEGNRSEGSVIKGRFSHLSGRAKGIVSLNVDQIRNLQQLRQYIAHEVFHGGSVYLGGGVASGRQKGTIAHKIAQKYKEHAVRKADRLKYEGDYRDYYLDPEEIAARAMERSMRGGGFEDKSLEDQFWTELGRKTQNPNAKKSFGLLAKLKSFFGLHQGGYIPGFAKGDEVPALLTPGEFVISKDTTSRIGVPNLRQLNQTGKIDHLPKFHKGGFVGIQRFASGGEPVSNKRITISAEEFNRELQKIVGFLRAIPSFSTQQKAVYGSSGEKQQGFSGGQRFQEQLEIGIDARQYAQSYRQYVTEKIKTDQSNLSNARQQAAINNELTNIEKIKLQVSQDSLKSERLAQAAVRERAGKGRPQAIAALEAKSVQFGERAAEGTAALGKIESDKKAKAEAAYAEALQKSLNQLNMWSLGLSIGAGYLSSALSKMAGTADQVVAAGEEAETRFKGFSIAAGGLQGASLGLTTTITAISQIVQTQAMSAMAYGGKGGVGGAVAGAATTAAMGAPTTATGSKLAGALPMLGVFGAIAGATIGIISAIDASAKQLREAKLAKAAFDLGKAFNEASEQFKNTGRVNQELVSRYTRGLEQRRELTAQQITRPGFFQRGMEGLSDLTGGRINILGARTFAEREREFETARERDITQQAPQTREMLRMSAQTMLSEQPGLNEQQLRQRLMTGAEGRMVQELREGQDPSSRRLTRDQQIKIEEQILEEQVIGQARLSNTNQRLQNQIQTTTSGFINFTTQMNAAGTTIRGLSESMQTLSGTMQGQLGVSLRSPEQDLSNMFSANFGTQIQAALKPLGGEAQQQGMGLAQVSELVRSPQLVQAFRQRIGSSGAIGGDAAANFAKDIRRMAGFREDAPETDLPPQLRQLILAFEEEIRKAARDPQKAQQLRDDPSGTIKKATEGFSTYLGETKRTIGEAAGALKQLNDVTNLLMRTEMQITQIKQRGYDLELESMQIMSGLTAQQFNISPLQTYSSQDFRNVQMRSVGEMLRTTPLEGRQIDVRQIGTNLRETFLEISRTEKEREKVSSTDQNAQIEFNKRLNDLNNNAIRYQNALNQMIDANKRYVDELKNRLSELQQAREARMGLATQFFGAAPEQRWQMMQSAQLTHQAIASGGNLNAFNPAQQQMIQQFMTQNQNLRISGMDQNLGQIWRDMVQTSMPSMFEGMEVDLSEEERLRNEIRNVLQQSADANKQLADALKEGGLKAAADRFNEAVTAFREAVNRIPQTVSTTTPRPAQPHQPTPLPVNGASLGGFIARGTDTVPALLSAGSFVVNRQSAAANSGLLSYLENGGSVGNASYYQGGGLVGGGQNLQVPLFNDAVGRFAINVSYFQNSISSLISQLSQAITNIGSGGAEWRLTGNGGNYSVQRHNGGPIFAAKGTDVVPAMLTPGEFVVNAESTRNNYGLLKQINGAKSPVYRAWGGEITNQTQVEDFKDDVENKCVISSDPSNNRFYVSDISQRQYISVDRNLLEEDPIPEIRRVVDSQESGVNNYINSAKDVIKPNLTELKTSMSSIKPWLRKFEINNSLVREYQQILSQNPAVLGNLIGWDFPELAGLTSKGIPTNNSIEHNTNSKFLVPQRIIGSASSIGEVGATIKELSDNKFNITPLLKEISAQTYKQDFLFDDQITQYPMPTVVDYNTFPTENSVNGTRTINSTINLGARFGRRTNLKRGEIDELTQRNSERGARTIVGAIGNFLTNIPPVVNIVGGVMPQDESQRLLAPYRERIQPLSNIINGGVENQLRQALQQFPQATQQQKEKVVARTIANLIGQNIYKNDPIVNPLVKHLTEHPDFTGEMRAGATARPPRYNPYMLMMLLGQLSNSVSNINNPEQFQGWTQRVLKNSLLRMLNLARTGRPDSTALAPQAIATATQESVQRRPENRFANYMREFDLALPDLPLTTDLYSVNNFQRQLNQIDKDNILKQRDPILNLKTRYVRYINNELSQLRYLHPRNNIFMDAYGLSGSFDQLEQVIIDINTIGQRGFGFSQLSQINDLVNEALRKGMLSLTGRAVAEAHPEVPSDYLENIEDIEEQRRGGPIFASKGTDVVPAMLTPGEFVVNPQATRQNYGLLKQINSSKSPIGLASGGLVSYYQTGTPEDDVLNRASQQNEIERRQREEERGRRREQDRIEIEARRSREQPMREAARSQEIVERNRMYATPVGRAAYHSSQSSYNLERTRQLYPSNVPTTTATIVTPPPQQNTPTTNLSVQGQSVRQQPAGPLTPEQRIQQWNPLYTAPPTGPAAWRQNQGITWDRERMPTISSLEGMNREQARDMMFDQLGVGSQEELAERNRRIRNRPAPAPWITPQRREEIRRQSEQSQTNWQNRLNELRRQSHEQAQRNEQMRPRDIIGQGLDTLNQVQRPEGQGPLPPGRNSLIQALTNQGLDNETAARRAEEMVNRANRQRQQRNEVRRQRGMMGYVPQQRYGYMPWQRQQLRPMAQLPPHLWRKSSGGLIPTMLSSGEFVVSPSLTYQYGGLLEAINYRDVGGPTITNGTVPSSVNKSGFNSSIFKPKGTDTVPAMLQPGSFVINRQATQANLGLLSNLSKGGPVSYYQRGGQVGGQPHYYQAGGTTNGAGGNLNLDLSGFNSAFDNFITRFGATINESVNQLQNIFQNLGNLGIPNQITIAGTHTVNVVIDESASQNLRTAITDEAKEGMVQEIYERLKAEFIDITEK